MSWKRISRCLILTAVCVLMLAAAKQQFVAAQAPSRPAVQTRDQNTLVIENDSELPDAYPRRPYQIRLAAHGGIPPYTWQRESGTLPTGLNLERNGLIHGEPEHGGDFQFTLSVVDNSEPRQAVQKTFVIHVRSAFNLAWKSPARVNGNRIDGSVEVSNTTPDDIDLTFIVLAVASDGRATAIGYQHFPLPRGTTAQELPFGDTLPRGGYVVHVDVVGEVAEKRLIYRERLQTGPLTITIGP